MTRTASRMITSGVGRSGSPSPRLMLPGFARSEIFRIMLFSMPRRNGGGWKGFNGAKLLAESLRLLVVTERDESGLRQGVVFTALVNHAEIAFNCRFFVGNDSIQLANLQ